jgi:hypothetical protein
MTFPFVIYANSIEEWFVKDSKLYSINITDESYSIILWMLEYHVSIRVESLKKLVDIPKEKIAIARQILIDSTNPNKKFYVDKMCSSIDYAIKVIRENKAFENISREELDVQKEMLHKFDIFIANECHMDDIEISKSYQNRILLYCKHANFGVKWDKQINMRKSGIIADPETCHITADEINHDFIADIYCKKITKLETIQKLSEFISKLIVCHPIERGYTKI